MRDKADNKQLRSFGLTVGGVFAFIGLWPVIYHGADPRWWSIGVATLLLVPAVVYPAGLFWVHKGWMAFGHASGWINTRIILGVVFYVVITPIGALRSWLGKDPMGRHLRPDLDSYRITRKPRPVSHLTKQY